MGRMWLQAFRPVPLEEPRAPRAEADVAVLRPRGSAWLRPLPGQDVFTVDAMRLLVDRLQDMLAVPLPFLAKVSFQLLLSRPAQDPFGDDGRQRGLEFQHYFLKLAPWIVRPATSPAARAGAMMAAIRSKLEVALERSRFPESNWRLVGISAAYLLTAPAQQLGEIPAPPPPNEAGGCWKELPESLAKKKAVWNPRNADHRCFMWCVLAHCLGVDKLDWNQRRKAATCSGSFPEQARRPGRRPAGWQPALADAGLDFSGLPTDRPVGFEDIDAFERRNAGRVEAPVEVFVFAWQRTQWQDGQEYFHILQQRAPANQGFAEQMALLLLHQGHFALIHNFQALASRQGVTLGATPSNGGGCKEYKCPKCMARFTKKASWQLHRSSRCYREVAERTRKVPLPDPEKRQHLLRYKPKASAELAPLVCYADLEVYSTPAPPVHVAHARPPRRPPATWRSGAAATSRPRS